MPEGVYGRSTLEEGGCFSDSIIEHGLWIWGSDADKVCKSAALQAVRLLLSSSELPSSGETIHEFVLHLSTHWAVTSSSSRNFGLGGRYVSEPCAVTELPLYQRRSLGAKCSQFRPRLHADFAIKRRGPRSRRSAPVLSLKLTGGWPWRPGSAEAVRRT